VVLPTFMTVPSVKVGFMVHPMSEDLEEYIDPPENPKRSNSGFFRGMDENQATQMFKRVDSRSNITSAWLHPGSASTNASWPHLRFGPP
jgi:hypothetical protein